MNGRKSLIGAAVLLGVTLAATSIRNSTEVSDDADESRGQDLDQAGIQANPSTTQPLHDTADDEAREDGSGEDETTPADDAASTTGNVLTMAGADTRLA